MQQQQQQQQQQQPPPLMALPAGAEYLSCEASLSDPGCGSCLGLRRLRAEHLGGPPRRADRPASDRRFDGGADPGFRRQAGESRTRLLARDERAVWTFAAVPLRSGVPDELFDQQCDGQTLRLLDKVTALQNRAGFTRRYERNSSGKPRGQETPPRLRFPNLSLSPFGQRSRLRARDLEGTRGFDRVPRPAHGVLRRALLRLPEWFATA